MPSIDDSTQTTAAPEDVWLLLYDPLRFPEWWTGIAATTTAGDHDYTMYLDGYPDFPMPQTLDAHGETWRVTISCTISDLAFAWRLEPIAAGGTKISVHVDIPESEAARLATQREVVSSSLRKLATLSRHAL